MKMLQIVAVGVCQEDPKIFRAPMYGALRGHLCDSTAFLLRQSLSSTEPLINVYN